MYNYNTDSLGLILGVEVFFSGGHCSGALCSVFSWNVYLCMELCGVNMINVPYLGEICKHRTEISSLFKYLLIFDKNCTFTILFPRNYPEKINLFVITFWVLEIGGEIVSKSIECSTFIAPEVIGQHTVFNKQAT